MGTVIGSFVGVLLAIGVAVLVLKKVMKKSDVPPPPPDAAPAGPATDPLGPEKALDALQKGLVALNITVRTTHNLPGDVIQLVEEVIDLLGDTTPQMMSRYPSESLTYELKRIAGDHLPQIVKEYIDLSDDSRKHQQDAIMAALGDIRDQVRRAKEIVAHNEVAEFKVMASFLKTKYASGKT